jgi:hypothetical protein
VDVGAPFVERVAFKSGRVVEPPVSWKILLKDSKFEYFFTRLSTAAGLSQAKISKERARKERTKRKFIKIRNLWLSYLTFY